MSDKVEAFFSKPGQWQEEYRQLRAIIRGCGLTEEFKWGNPCYTDEGQNIVLIHGFKEYCALLFFKGALMKDPKKILIQQAENVQAARQIRFTSEQEVEALQAILTDYIGNAIDVEKSGAKVAFKETREFEVAEEFQLRLDQSPSLRTAFEALTPGRQRAYLLHFSSARQTKTRAARVEKCLPQILSGKGLDD